MLIHANDLVAVNDLDAILQRRVDQRLDLFLIPDQEHFFNGRIGAQRFARTGHDLLWRVVTAHCINSYFHLSLSSATCARSASSAALRSGLPKTALPATITFAPL